VGGGAQLDQIKDNWGEEDEIDIDTDAILGTQEEQEIMGDNQGSSLMEQPSSEGDIFVPPS